MRIYNAKFQQNYAESDSAISAFMTTSLEYCIIQNSNFFNNSANSNTISIRNSQFLISDCKFQYNTANVYSANIFLSFSKVNITNTIMQDEYMTNPKLVMDSRETQGRFLFLSLGVTLHVDSSQFLNGISS